MDEKLKFYVTLFCFKTFHKKDFKHRNLQYGIIFFIRVLKLYIKSDKLKKYVRT